MQGLGRCPCTQLMLCLRCPRLPATGAEQTHFVQAAANHPEQAEQGRHRFHRLHQAQSGAHGAVRRVTATARSSLAAAQMRLGRLASSLGWGRDSFGCAWQSFWHTLSVCWEWLAAAAQGLWHRAAAAVQSSSAKVRSLGPRQAQIAGAASG